MLGRRYAHPVISQAPPTGPVLDVAAFRSAYAGAVRDVLPFLTPDRLRAVARHNPGWHPEAFDFASYLRASEARYVRALELFLRAGGGAAGGALRTLEVGGFMATFPLALARVGARATLSEKYGYYYGAFDELRDFLVAEGVEVWDLDLTEPLADAPAGGFDLVTNMAMLEHLPNSPRPLMENMRALLAPTGHLVLDVPNIAYWHKRLRALRGRSIHPSLRDVLDAEVPFTGHHREYTIDEVRSLLEWTGFTPVTLETVSYSPDPGRSPLGLAYKALWDVLDRFPALREVIVACARVSPRTSPDGRR